MSLRIYIWLYCIIKLLRKNIGLLKHWEYGIQWFIVDCNAIYHTNMCIYYQGLELIKKWGDKDRFIIDKCSRDISNNNQAKMNIKPLVCTPRFLYFTRVYRYMYMDMLSVAIFVIYLHQSSYYKMNF